MKHNIIIYNDSTKLDNQLPFKLTHAPISYRVSPDRKCYVTESVNDILLEEGNFKETTNPKDMSFQPNLTSETKILLSTKLKNILQDVQVQAK